MECLQVIAWVLDDDPWRDRFFRLQTELGSECGVDEGSLLLEVVFRSGGVALILPSHHASHLYILISFGLFEEKRDKKFRTKYTGTICTHLGED